MYCLRLGNLAIFRYNSAQQKKHWCFESKFNYTHQEVIMALDSAKKQEIVKQFGKSETDTGSTAVQIALLSVRIADLTEHLKVFKKDHASRLGLLKLVGQRRRLMRYLKRTNREEYVTLIEALSLRDNI
jgi:small subunit ribosomal protein S15